MTEERTKSEHSPIVRLSREDSAYIKGFAMLFMIIHHLFAEDIIPLMYPVSPMFCLQIGQFNQVCVSMFLFVSGFGMYRAGDKPIRTLKRIPQLYIRLWAVMVIVTIPVMLLTGHFSFNILELVKNIFAINTTYNSAWWFAFLYAKVMLMHAVLLLLPDNGKGGTHLVLTLICIIVSIVTFVLTPYTSGLVNLGFSQVSEACFYFSVLLMGRYAAQHELLERLLTALTRRGRLHSGLLSLLLLAVAFGLSVLLPYIGVIRLYINLFTLPLVLTSVLLIRYAVPATPVYQAVVWYGQASVWTWLIHMIFISYLPEITFILKLPLLTVIWMVILNLVPAFLMSMLWRLIRKKDRHPKIETT